MNEERKQFNINKMYADENRELWERIGELQKELEPRTKVKTVLEDIGVITFVAFLTAWAVSILISMVISLILNQKGFCL